MSTWQSQTVVSLLERDPAVRVFNIWTLLDRSLAPPDDVAAWPGPGLAALQGTTLGATDFALFSRGLGDGNRVGIRNGQLAPLPRAEWKVMPIEEEFNALLYLGPPSSMTDIGLPAALCRDRQFVTGRLQRLMRFSPPMEVENFRKACGL